MNSLPSPASSPSPPSLDSSAQPSRKRQRSQSMHSDKSSASVKRSASEAPAQDAACQNTQADQMSTLSLADQNQDIDAYMATQGEANIPPTLSLPDHSRGTDSIKGMSPLEKLGLVEDGKKKKMEIGEVWFLVSYHWWRRWEKACTGEEDKEGSVTEEELGPVDNASLLDSQGNLKQGLVEGKDVEFVPDKIWDCFINWYGQASHVLSRRVVPRGVVRHPVLELFPPRFKVLTLAKTRRTLRTNQSTSQWVTISSGETLEKLCTRLVQVVKPMHQSNTPYRIWRVDANDEGWDHSEFPCERLLHARGKIIEESTKTLEEEGLESEDAFVVEFKQLEGWIVDSNGTHPQLPTASAPIFSSSDAFFNKMGNGSSSTRNRTSDPYSSFKSPQKSSPPMSLLNNARGTRSLEPGTLGLTNMGNTCFMNSALQCLAHTKELSDYFLSGVFEEELNADNPLGMGGAIAEAFGALLQRIWATSGPSTSYSPRDFKQALQRFAPQFSGYQQHDSQELVAFLLDGLHEDLNRIHKKPYVEKPDWEGGGDLELVQLAKKSWDGYLLRNDSVIVDLFQGQYQSTLVCPECEKVSITFDPFMYLTLPIPIQKKWTHTIYYVPWDPSQSHCKVPVELNREASFREVRNLLGRWMDAPPDNLLTLEVFSHKFYKNLDDNVLVGDMAEHDTIVCYELPCNAQQQRGYKRQPTDPFILPVFLCDARIGNWNSYMSSRVTLFGYPTVVVLTPEQASDVDVVYGVVLERLTRFTDNSRDLFDWEHGTNPEITEVQLGPSGISDVITEIGENGEIVTLENQPEEGDIVDEKAMIVDEGVPEVAKPGEPQAVGYKKGVFNLRLHSNHKDFGASSYAATITHKWEPWKHREEMLETRGSLVREGDALYCEFDENMKAYYFGESATRFEHARWDRWEEFIHPEYEELLKAAAEKKHRGISLQDCLDEFTKEEQLGEDDLWYCPRCKKHQQATKRFDLWKTPDILVVHLKRFSNSRTLRDKIDAFIDFPTKGLDLEDMVRERAVAKKLKAQGLDIEELKLTNLDEPLVYDLFGVDEHIGGLGGGHYRAYGLNHLNSKWYHFDDSFVKPAHAEDAINADAYLLFYRRRTTKPLGGKSQERIIDFKAKAEARKEVAPPTPEVPISIDNQLPTPPDDNGLAYPGPPPGDLSDRLNGENGRWAIRSGASVSSLTPSDGPPEFEEGSSGALYMEPLEVDDSTGGRFDYIGEPSSNRPSPTSSLGAEVDFAEPRPRWNDGPFSDLRFRGLDARRGSPSVSHDWDDSGSNLASPSYSNPSSDNTNDTSGKKTFTTAEEDIGDPERERSP